MKKTHIPDPDPKKTREILFRVFMYLMAVDFDNRDKEWDEPYW